MRFLIALATLFLGVTAYALPLSEPTDTATIRLDDVVVSASKWQEDSHKQPKHIDVIRPSEVHFAQPMTTADLLELSRGVYIQKSQLGGGSPMIRGMATNRLLYAVDGVRMNTAIFRSGNLQNVISLDPFALSRTEVVYGPGSVIYGSDAMGGVMSFQTKNPVFAAQGEKFHATGTALARYASAANEVTGHFDISLAGQRWAALTSISSFNYGDLRQGRHGPDEYLKPYLVQQQSDGDVVLSNPDPLVQSPSGYNQINLMQKVAYRPTEAWNLQYALHYSTTSDYARYDRHTRLKNDLPQYAQWDYGPQVWMMNQLTAVHTPTPIGSEASPASRHMPYDQMAIRLAVQRFEESRIDRKLNKAARTTTCESVNAYSADLDFTKHLGHHTLYYGMEYVRNDVHSTGSETNIYTGEEQPALARYPQAVWESYAAYVQSNFSLLPCLNLEAGLRYNHYRLAADFSNQDLELGFAPRQHLHKGSLSGSLGLSYRPGHQWLLRLEAARGFRTPNVDDLGKLYESVEGCVVVPNPRLKPEYANSIEIGAARRVARWLSFDVATYYTHLTNAFVRRPFTLNGHATMLYKGEESQVLAIQNAARAFVAGFELTLKGNLPAGLGYDVNMVYQYGREELDDGSHSTLRHAVPFYGRAALHYQHKKARLELYSHFQACRSYRNMPESERSKTEIYALDAHGHVYSPAWGTLGLRAQYQPIASLTLGACLENITNQRYRHYSSGISAPGINFIMSVAYGF